MKTDLMIENINNEIDAIKEKYRLKLISDIIKPFCEKYGFEYIEGNGTYYFKKTNNNSPASWCKGHYYMSNEGIYLNQECNNKIVKNLISEINNVFDLIYYR